ncbi:hypothetical protein BCV69DRAFT_105342 [Microstroma glucosiphilum]|uniref:TMEM205-like domain-containing protein n=1 Tax=Pseudomicrostroma glucosiphilum TaxID=1684307 RepID=A0A316UCU1_9BASI|nr:hypothetical protein BCV69DRAFT_105342 [Pseudomicrostroma glucosiphilum]PWN23016.1 hypothetical protein BCV69DRAFT_105342 [Pseudomicrostroma glucosiphilum]
MATQSNPANVGLSMWKVLLTPNSASIHLILFSTLFGSHFFHGFIGGPVTFQQVPRKTFGLMQSKIFPIYFAMGTVTPAALIGNLALAQGSLSAVPTFPLAALGISMVANAINWLYLGPKATNVMFERHELEREEGIDAYKDKDKASPKMKQLSKTFGQLHGISSLLNLTSFGALILHGSVSVAASVLSVWSSLLLLLLLLARRRYTRGRTALDCLVAPVMTIS